MKIYILNVPLQNSAIISENNSFWNESATKNSEAGCFSAHLKRKKKWKRKKDMATTLGSRLREKDSPKRKISWDAMLFLLIYS